MLAIRSTLKLDAPIAYIPSSTSSSTTGSTTGTGEEKIYLMVSLSYLRVLIDLSNDKFRMNVAQMARFEERLTKHLLTAENVTPKKVGDQGGEWEDKEARKERKRREGMLKQEETAKARAEKKKATAEAAAEAARKAAADAAAAGTGPTAAETTEDKTATIS